MNQIAYSIAEAADALRCSRSHINALIARGDLRRVKVGSRTLIPASEIDRVLSPTSPPEGGPQLRVVGS